MTDDKHQNEVRIDTAIVSPAFVSQDDALLRTVIVNGFVEYESIACIEELAYIPALNPTENF